jgi:hypothetical protein
MCCAPNSLRLFADESEFKIGGASFVDVVLTSSTLLWNKKGSI